MPARENDDYVPDEGHSVSGNSRKPKHLLTGGHAPRPGQRGENKRKRGEKPVVQVKWTPQLTEQLWALIKAKPELKRLLVNEPSRHLGPMGAGMQLFSKKDLQRTIAEHLFNDGSYDLNDPVVMDNLTRAVKNKLHKTQMLYDEAQRQMPQLKDEYQSEDQIPPEHRALWSKIKDRFPTYFEYHELALELPAIIAQMARDAQQFGAWKSRALSVSDGGSENSFISNHQRARSVETSASFEVPEEFEVLPPPVDTQATFSDAEPFGLPVSHGISPISPSLSPAVSPSGRFMPLQQTSFGNDAHLATWSAQNAGAMGRPVSAGALPSHIHTNQQFKQANDGIPGNWTTGLTNQLTQEPQSYDNSAIGPWSSTASPLAPVPSQARFPSMSVQDVSRNGQHLSAQTSRRVPSGKHRRGPSMEGFGNGEHPPPSLSPQATSPFSNVDYSSNSGSPEMPMSDSQDEKTMDALFSILRERELRKRQRQEEWIRIENKRLEDREKQRIENQRQREENERQRQHEAMIMEQRLQYARLVAPAQYRSGSVPTQTGSNVTSPINLNDQQDPMAGMYTNPSIGMNDMMAQFSSIAPESHGSYEQQQQQHPQLRSMGVHVSPYQPPRGVAHLDMSEAVPTQTFANEPLNDQQLEDFFGTGVPSH
ncbi:SubName: Full=Uncharacterized protein {ECO:0000313/EMBL:CCA70887.1} [Serendipita indica DSM 11827]|nr:SubName: Full=Uncharacterized protein {ECO:0000313/EMBL:CCA70887.1} [Serendipita indica DSM 11827]